MSLSSTVKLKANLRYFFSINRFQRCWLIPDVALDFISMSFVSVSTSSSTVKLIGLKLIISVVTGSSISIFPLNEKNKLLATGSKEDKKNQLSNSINLL